MSDRAPIPLTPVPFGLDSPEFGEICGWPFADDYIRRLLRDDIPRRVSLWDCRIWIYHDPDKQVVGFGSLEVGEDYLDFTDGRPHPYIPLLAVNPTMEGRGHGKSIVWHLIGEAVILASGTGGRSDVLFLDVYADNLRAIDLYVKYGFVKTKEEPRPDPKERNRPYIIMSKKLRAAPI